MALELRILTSVVRKHHNLFFVVIFLNLICNYVSNAFGEDPSKQVEVFVASDCPHCDRMIQFLRDEQIPFVVYQLEQNKIAEKDYFDFFGRGILPAVRIGDRGFRGYRPELVYEFLEKDGLPVSHTEIANNSESGNKIIQNNKTIPTDTSGQFVADINSTSSVAADSPATSLTKREKNARKVTLVGYLLIACVVWFLVFALGLSGAVVVFFDPADFYGTAGAILVPAVGILLQLFGGQSSFVLEMFSYLFYALGAYLLLRNFYLSIKWNRNLISGLILGIFKITVFWAVVLLFISSIAKQNKRFSDYYWESVIAGALFCLINGPRVWEKKGWISSENSIVAVNG